MTGRITPVALAAVLGLSGYHLATAAPATQSSGARLLDANDGDDWAGYGRTYGEQHYSPQSDLNAGNISRLGLAWSYDLPAGNPMSGPIEVGGTLFTSTGYSVVRAFDAQTGTLLWTFDPKAPEASGKKLRQGWGSRGIAWWNGKVYVGTQDGRLIAIDAHTGRQVWSSMTVGKDDYRFISGAPRVFDGKVIIGHGGADAGDTRGYVTAYDAETGKQLWRFFTVPGNPADGFEDEAQAMAAKTWSGKWWEYGGGGTAWNAFAYDRETDTILVGTGNGAPWNRKIRSEGKGDNLFLASIVALDAKTGKYKWHYQVNPGETWDYNASMDMQLADLVIDGKLRKVVMQLPKNGFFYVIDRTNGQMISADKVTFTTWADRIDPNTGRPVENPDARFPSDGKFTLFPGPMGAHTWLPTAFDSKNKLIYLPVTEMGAGYDATGFKPGWRRPPNNLVAGGYGFDLQLGEVKGAPATGSFLMAWDPVARKEVWRTRTPGSWGGGLLATGGNLVFQGDATGNFTAYEAGSGKVLWRYNAQAPVLAPPITYRVQGHQYVTVLTGIGTSAGMTGILAPTTVDYRTQARRVLTFALDSAKQLAKSEPFKLTPPDDADFKPDVESATRGGTLFFQNCMVCHGPGAVAGGTAPDLRGSPVPVSFEAFKQVVHGGELVSNGMPQFDELTDAALMDIRQYIRTRADELRKPHQGS